MSSGPHAHVANVASPPRGQCRGSSVLPQVANVAPLSESLVRLRAPPAFKLTLTAPRAAKRARPTRPTAKAADGLLVPPPQQLHPQQQHHHQQQQQHQAPVAPAPPAQMGANDAIRPEVEPGAAARFEDKPDLPENCQLANCSECSEPIHDRFLFKVIDQHYHERCLHCADCQQPFQSSCYAKNGRVYCKLHFYRRYGPKCSKCREPVAEKDVVRKANSHVYHLECFKCVICERELSTGDQFYLIPMDGRLVCRTDYENSTKESEMDCSNKRPRTTISAKSLETLKQAYQASSKPARHVREQLAAETGLDMRVVQVWFQNRRAKEKRLKKDASRRWPATAAPHVFSRTIDSDSGSNDESLAGRSPAYAHAGCGAAELDAADLGLAYATPGSAGAMNNNSSGGNGTPPHPNPAHLNNNPTTTATATTNNNNNNNSNSGHNNGTAGADFGGWPPFDEPYLLDAAPMPMPAMERLYADLPPMPPGMGVHAAMHCMPPAAPPPHHLPPPLPLAPHMLHAPPQLAELPPYSQ